MGALKNARKVMLKYCGNVESDLEVLIFAIMAKSRTYEGKEDAEEEKKLKGIIKEKKKRKAKRQEKRKVFQISISIPSTKLTSFDY